MLSAFWSGIGDKLADRWAETSMPALIFWTGGLLTWISHSGQGVVQGDDRWIARESAPLQVAVLVGILVGIVLSGVIVDRFSGLALRFLEGYWPAILEPASRRLAERVGARATELRRQFQVLTGPVLEGTATQQQRSEYVTLDHQLHWLPSDGSYRPTTVGNILCAAEGRPLGKYGLEAVTVWPRLWLLLPDTARAELAASRRSLDLATAACVWGSLFVLFTPLAWWAAVAGIAVAFLAYRFWLRWRAVVFADLLDASFDLYRGRLYEQLRWPLPVDPDAERLAGEQLTTYLWRGLPGNQPVFSPPAGH